MRFSNSVLLLASVAITSAPSAKLHNLISLADGIKPLATRFNEHQDRAQVVAILSPT